MMTLLKIAVGCLCVVLGSSESFATTCAQKQFKSSGSAARCMTNLMSKFADTNSDVQVSDITPEVEVNCRRQIFKIGDACAANNEKLWQSISMCTKYFADRDRHIFDDHYDFAAVRPFGAALYCELRAAMKYTASQPERATERQKCEDKFLLSVTDPLDPQDADGSEAIARLKQCVDGIDRIIEQSAATCEAPGDCGSNSSVCSRWTCLPNAICAQEAVLCTNGEQCNLSSGCAACSSNSDCTYDDGLTCTSNVCGQDGWCMTEAVQCASGLTCSEPDGCAECITDAECDQSGTDECEANKCIDRKCQIQTSFCNVGFRCGAGSHECERSPLVLALVPGDGTRNGFYNQFDHDEVDFCLGSTDLNCSKSDCDCNGVVEQADHACIDERAQRHEIARDFCRIQPGDLDHDGDVDVNDKQNVSNCKTIAGTSSPGLVNADCFVAADCDCNGQLNDDDVQCTQTRMDNSGTLGAIADPCLVCPANAQLVLADPAQANLLGRTGSIITAEPTAVGLTDDRRYRSAEKSIAVAVIDPATQQTYPDCQVTWTPATSSGAAFAVPSESYLEKNDGIASAWWIAGPHTSGGSPDQQTLVASINRRGASPFSLPISALAYPQSTYLLARHTGFVPSQGEVVPTDARGYSLDVKIVQDTAKAIFLAGPVHLNHRVGLLNHPSSAEFPNGHQELQFSVFREGCPEEAGTCNTDSDCSVFGPGATCGSNHKCDINLSCTANADCTAKCGDHTVCETTGRCYKEIPTFAQYTKAQTNWGIYCGGGYDSNPIPIATTCKVEHRPVNDSAPRWFPSRTLPDNGGPIWHTGDTLRFRVLIKTYPDRTHFTFKFANLGNPPVEPANYIVFESMDRYPAIEPNFSMSAFVEQPSRVMKPDCYSLSQRVFEYSNAKYLPTAVPPELTADEASWVPLKTARSGGEIGCQNDDLKLSSDGKSFQLRVGEPTIPRPPFLHPSRSSVTLTQ